MKIALRNLHTGKYVSSWDAPHTLIANRDAIGPGEEFELVVLDPPPAPPVDVWPPPPGTVIELTPDADTEDPVQCLRFIREALWTSNNSDDESYYLSAILLRPEPGHRRGWTASGYWRTEKIWQGEGRGKGYQWPPN